MDAFFLRFLKKFTNLHLIDIFKKKNAAWSSAVFSNKKLETEFYICFFILII